MAWPKTTQPCSRVHGQITALADSLGLRFERPNGAVSTGISIRYGRRSGCTATSEGGWRAAHADGDLDCALAEPLPSFRAAYAVSVFEAAARRRLYRARLRAHRVRRGVGADAGADRLSRRPFWRAKSAADRALPRRLRACPARLASELRLAGGLRRAARACQQRLSPGRLCDPRRPHGRG